MAAAIVLILFTLLSLLMAPGHAWENLTFADRNAMVFEHRHRAYGAYRLRRRYDRHLAAGLCAALGLLALVALGAKWLSSGTATLPPVNKGPVIDDRLARMVYFPPGPPAPAMPAAAPAVKPKAVGNKEVPPLVEGGVGSAIPAPPPVDPTMLGTGGAAEGQDPGNGGQAGIGWEPGVMGDGANAGGWGAKVYEGIEVQELPEFPGGEAALAQWVNGNLDYLPDRPGLELVFVQFTVMRDGRVENVQAVKGRNKALRAAAERALRRMPRWRPARMNGEEVPCRLTLPIRLETR
ncbi:MAG: energy transducer TonB [Flavobacteriales bacterium]|nr:energy transducer TonB [Flavobacteriales bacterium]MEB2343004.1 energy transducer TonB [Flavobacteriia bacterium]